MFATFFHELKAAKVPVTLKEYLTLMEALEADLADRSVEHFYYLSRAALGLGPEERLNAAATYYAAAAGERPAGRTGSSVQDSSGGASGER